MLFQRLLRSKFYNTHRSSLTPVRPQFRPLRTPRISPVQRRGYRPINYRHFLTSWNTLREWSRSPLFYLNVAGILSFWGVFYYSYLERVQATGRSRFNIVSPHWEEQLAKKLQRQYADDADFRELPHDAPEHVVAQRVFDRMIPHSRLPQAEWHMTVYNHHDQVAFVLIGGNVFISTGMVNFCRTDDELASIFGHEIAHHVCHHNAESMSRSLIHVVTLLGSWLASGMDPDLVAFAVDIMYRLPGSRVQEREADQLGLLIMAESGYDPSACFDVWSRWEDVEPSERPSYLSTHPSHRERSVSIWSWLNAAREERLWKLHTEDDFRVGYYLQRSFCGLNRGLWQTISPD